MTTPQRIHLQADLWPAACSTQGWQVKDRAKRLEVCGAALGRTLKTTNDIGDHDEFTRVKTRLLALAANLQAISEDGDLTQSATRTRLEKIRRQAKCIALYPLDAPRGQAGAEHYIRTLIKTTSSRAGYEPAQFDAAPFEHLLAGLDLKSANRLVMTLDNRLHNARTGMRVLAKHTLHDMLTAAALPCHCIQCSPRRPALCHLPSATYLAESAASAICHLPSAISEPDPF